MARVEVLAPFPHPTVADVMVGRGSQVDITDDALLSQLNNEGKVALLEPASGGGEPPPPVQITGIVTEFITSASATIRFTVDRECTDMHVHYGPTTDYDAEQPATPASGSGACSVVLAGLTAETLYHFHIAVTCAGAETLSPDTTFTTTA